MLECGVYISQKLRTTLWLGGKNVETSLSGEPLPVASASGNSTNADLFEFSSGGLELLSPSSSSSIFVELSLLASVGEKEG